MELKDTIQQRYSVRSFSDKKVPLNLIHEMIEFANLAPSAGNLQARDFIIVDDTEIKKRISRAAFDQNFIIEAPVNIVVCANLNRISSYGRRGRDLYCIQDSAAAVEHILLLAVDNELGACWVGAFNENDVTKILNLPPFIIPIAIIPMGYPKKNIESTSRIKTNSLIHHNGW